MVILLVTRHLTILNKNYYHREGYTNSPPFHFLWNKLINLLKFYSRSQYSTNSIDFKLIVISYYRTWLTNKIKTEVQRFILSNLGGVLIHFLLRV